MSLDLFKFSNHYFADFETTSMDNYLVDGEVRVWAWRILDIFGNACQGTDLLEFLYYCRKISKGNSIYIWFHNLKFDFSYIESFLLSSTMAQFKHELPMKYKYQTWGREYTTTRDDMGNLYGARWFTSKGSVVSFYDSAKIFPTTAEELGKLVGVRKLTEKIDYEAYRPLHYEPTDDEWEYLKNDVDILRDVMIRHFEDHPNVKMTRSSYAFSELKAEYNKQNTPKNWAKIKKDNKYKRGVTYFDHCFPSTNPDLYRKLQKAYAGGIVYVKPELRNKIIVHGQTYDVNSEYPAAMLDNMYPIGKESEFAGYYGQLPDELKKEYPLYVQSFRCDFKLKPNGFPCLPKKYSDKKRTVYSSDQLIGTKTLQLCCVDFEHFLKNYDVDPASMVFLGGFMWHAIHAPFRSFIEKCAQKKISAQQAGNFVVRFFCKLDMNGCYGKFAQNPYRNSKEPYLDKNGVLRYKDVEEEHEARNYFPMAIFITAYARDIFLRGVYAVGVDRVVYGDTDSMHITGWDVPKNLPIDKYKLGFWKCEKKFIEGKFLRDKMYAETFIDEDGNLITDVKGAGLSDDVKAEIGEAGIQEYMIGKTYNGNLQARQVKGGTLLIKQSKYVKPDMSVATADEILRDIDHESTKVEQKKEADRQIQLRKEELLKGLSQTGQVQGTVSFD